MVAEKLYTKEELPVKEWDYVIWVDDPYSITWQVEGFYIDPNFGGTPFWRAKLRGPYQACVHVRPTRLVKKAVHQITDSRPERPRPSFW